MYPNYPNPNQPYPQMPQYPPQMPGQMPYGDPNQQFQQYPPAPGGQYAPPMPGGQYPPAMPPMQGQFPPAMPPPMQGQYQQPPMQQYAPMHQQQYAPMPGGQFEQSYQQTNYHQQQQQPSMSAPPHRPRPTVVAPPTFDASNDAAVLRKAMKGWGTDEAALINVLCRRPVAQRMEIVRAYKTAYGKDLLEDVRSETSNNFQRVLFALLTPKVQFYCEELFEAMEGKGTDEDVLVEVLCGGLPNREVQMITAEYLRLYGKTLEAALKEETSYSFKRLLVSLSTGNRDESTFTDLNAARVDAQALKDAGVNRFGTDESEFNRILCMRNFQQIRLIAEEYEKMTGNTLEKDIKKEFSGDVEDGMVAVLRCAINQPLFFAKRIRKAISGLGTNDRDLIRLCVTRSEIDMMDIKDEYQKKYNESMRDAIKGDTSGHYKHALYVLIGENKS